ncbi:metal-dependent transcriptional regulator [Cryobacterium algoricola]|uniref:Manganese transport regulator n=2 Tax=Cryobacterium TaxID=69578 RepID=A0AA41UFG4_9MICO|nr:MULTISPECIES: metal-dependent transcriptional regulator [Cryobacterium]MCI4657935.1 metal-dependent transcriptional regulator [Cryobacterium zhongshanensis]TFB88998.1 metal-dependent transcriptional regulator [Cryobacterium algoricola]
MKHNGTSTPASEDYLKTIYAHTEWQPERITPSALAARLGVAPSSVTEMVKKLAAAGLITHVPYGPLALTPAGVLRASAVVRRHRLIETWLVQEMGYDWDEVHDEAEILEHALSDRLLDAIDERLGRPVIDPHGDAIPAADGTVLPRSGITVDRADPGLVGVVLRVSDRDPVVLRGLARDGIGPGTELEVREPGRVRLPGGDIRPLSDAEAASIWLTVPSVVE